MRLRCSPYDAVRVRSSAQPPGARDDFFTTSERSDANKLAQYAEHACFEYAVSLVKGRTIPDLCNGQKQVRGVSCTRHSAWVWLRTPSPSRARIAGDVLGKFHPHRDTAAYTTCRCESRKGLTQRYRRIDSRGNFGSRDGDGAAAMRYAEARLAPIARLPARMAFLLLNGASGIVVGPATKVPSHDLREVAAAAMAMIRDDKLPDDEIFAPLHGLDFPGGAQAMSTPVRDSRLLHERARQREGARAGRIQNAPIQSANGTVKVECVRGVDAHESAAR